MDVSRSSLFRRTAWLDERIFEAIFNEQYAKLYAILFRLTGDRATADDLAAETFWRLWERPPATSENLSGWLYRVAVRLGYNSLRDRRRREEYESATLQAPAAGSPVSEPEQAAEQSIERRRVRTVLRKMSFKDVQLLTLRHSGLSYKEISAAVQIPVTSVGTFLSRAEARFEALYSEDEKSDAPQR